MKIEIGEYGLYYLTDVDFPGLFIAGCNRDEVLRLAEIGKDVLERGSGFLPKHTLYNDGDRAMTFPDPDWQTREQCEETLKRIQIARFEFIDPKGSA